MPTILRITARRAGFRRAGLAHPAAPVDHPIERFSAEQLAALQAETMLVVEQIEVEADKKAAPKNNPKNNPVSSAQAEPQAGSAPPAVKPEPKAKAKAERAAK